MGLFLDTDDAQLFEAQTEAISALAGCWRPTVRIGAAFSRKAGNSVGGVPLRPRPVDDAAASA